MLTKRIPCPERIRRIPRQFSWVDHRLVRDKRLCGLSHAAQSLYLFLVTVSDADGVSYYSDAAVERLLSMESSQLTYSWGILCGAGLLAYSRPFYQILSLDGSGSRLSYAPCEYPFVHVCDRGGDVPADRILREDLGGAA
jgi:hypothetical protein